MFVDSHCHLNLLDLAKLGLSLADVIQNALDNKVHNLLSVATDLTQHQILTKIAKEFPIVKISAGLHPEHAASMVGYNFIDDLLQSAANQSVVAIGETGLDYYHIDSMDESEIANNKKLQQAAFIQQIHVAKILKKPLIVHTRMAQKDTINVLINEQAHIASGVMHCFTENWDMAKQALDVGFYISFSGIITFNSKVEKILEVVKKVPLDRILIETDSPYLAPVPFRGKINQPSYVAYVARKVAEVKNIPIDEVAYATTLNYQNLFQKLLA